MCSIGEDDFGDEGGAHNMIPEAQDTLQFGDLAGICRKCNSEQSVVKLSNRAAECRTCFLAYVRHKFRASLGSSKILPKNADVCVIFDGSPASAALLHMTYFAQAQSTFKRLHCNMKVIFIDDSCLGHQQNGYREDVLKILQNYSFMSSFYISLASNCEPIPIRDVADICASSTQLESMLKTTVLGIKQISSQQDFLTNLRKNVIRSAAHSLNSQFVFLPDITTDLATVFLTNISLGRGHSTADDVALLDERLEYIKLVRPLKDLSASEVDYYVQLNELSVVEHRFYGDAFDSTASIQNLTKNFVRNLQEKFPSTVSTVFRTASKIKTKNQSNDRHKATEQTSLGICKLCQSEIDQKESKTLFAVEFSRIVSEFAAGGLEDIENLEQKAIARLNANVCKEFCHACQTIRSDADDCAELERFL